MDTSSLPASLDLNSWLSLIGGLLAFVIPIILLVPPVSPRPSDALVQTHSIAGIQQSKSNIIQEAIEKAPPTIKGLLVYPIKSCAGVELAQSRVLPHGLEHDRVFTFAQLKSQFPVAVDADGNQRDKHSWEFITQRQFARLALLKIELWLPDEAKLKRQGLGLTQEAFVTVRFPWKELGWRGILETTAAKFRRGLWAEAEREVLLPMDFPLGKEIEDKGYTYEPVTIWKDSVMALNMAKELPEELQLFIGVSNKLALFRVDPAQLRNVTGNAPKKVVAGYQPVAKFQDAYPLNLINLASVQDFDAHVPKDEDLKQVDVFRFRPNIIISGAPAYAEESWKKIRFTRGTSNFHRELAADVCKLPNVDPVTAVRHPTEPDKSLRTHRKVDEGAPLKGCMGMQMVPMFDDIFATSTPGTVELSDLYGWIGTGMEIAVDEIGKHVIVK
ncbi:MOSC domain-containing protein [Microdochium bolleyi]|uniref:MOSC domain-containing protein n=1 Tax=Microdochium bolleyi TaxID=196109 RepID=A0A136J502_9PEZI|nr:MOSC domain-containing protein [Microdochium bolleyi]